MVYRGDMPRQGRRGFSLTELLVVIGITTVLLFLLFIPLSRALDLAARAEGRVSAQDTVRGAVRRITRDLQNAMVVYPPRELQVWGFDQWVNPKNRPVPAPGAVPEPYLVRNGLIAFRLPKYRHFCQASEMNPALQDHYINPDELGLVMPGQVVESWVACLRSLNAFSRISTALLRSASESIGTPSP